MAAQHWEKQIQDKQRRQQASIPRDWLIDTSGSKDDVDVSRIPDACGLLTSRELEITGTSDIATLLQKIANGEWSSVDVTTAFYKRAVVAHQLALQRAKQLDDYLQEHGRVSGPLHGLPISLKDQICIKGLETTMGYAAWIGQLARDDAVLVKLLLQCGAVLLVRTNVPQTLMWGETHNNIFGRTLNPFNVSLTPGGSSGGEAALIAMRGSVLGVGSDIGGSIRVPAHFCGIYGFKPSSHRIPAYGIVNSLEGQDSIPTSLGPLSTSMAGLTLFTRAVLSQQPWRYDPTAICKPWNDDDYALKDKDDGKGLCFGIMWDEGSIRPHPPIIRALEQTKKALENAGHRVIEWKAFKAAEIIANARSVWLADGGADYKACLTTGEPLINSMIIDADPLHVPAFRKPREPLSAYELWQLHRQRRDLRKAHLDYWESTTSRTGTGRPIDALLSPVAAYAAVPHGQTRSSVYTIPWNSLDYPALVIPVTRVDPQLDVKVAREFLSADDEDIDGLYDPELFSGMPVGVQLVGRTHQEEALLAIGEIVDSALKFEYLFDLSC